MEKSQIPKLHHYVPRFLLRNFAIEDTERVHVFDKQGERQFTANVRNMAAEKGFYNIDVDGTPESAEVPLGNLESTASRIIGKIVHRGSVNGLTDQERVVLSLFVAAQLVRTKQQRVYLQQISEAVLELVIEKGKSPGNTEDLDEWLGGKVKESSVLGLPRMIVGLAPLLYQKPWLLFRPPPSESYYISDNPVVMQNMNDRSPRGNLGLAVPGIEIYLPLTPALVLAIYCPSHAEMIRQAYRKYLLLKRRGLLDQSGVGLSSSDVVKQLKYALETGNAVPTARESVINQNSLQVAFSTRFIFSSYGDFGLAREMLAENRKLKKPPSLDVA